MARPAADEKRKDSWEELLDPEKRVEIKLESALKRITENRIIQVVIKSDHYSAVQTGLLEFLKKKFGKGVFVSANKALVNLFDSKEQPEKESSIVFVDMISESAGTEKPIGKNLHYLESPQNLMELNELAEKTLSEMSGPKFLLLDSLSTLLLYNKPETVEKFVHTLAGKIRNLDALGIFLTVQLKENEDAIRVISQFCDHTIEIDETQSRTQ